MEVAGLVRLYIRESQHLSRALAEPRRMLRYSTFAPYVQQFGGCVLV
jgi:hypothetical protein